MTPSDEAPLPSRKTQMSSGAREHFQEELLKLRGTAGPGPRDRVVGRLGLGLVVVGIAIVLITYSQATADSDVRDQLESVILAILGGSLMIVGGLLYVAMSFQRFMRFWLLRVIYEQRDLANGPSSPDAATGKTAGRSRAPVEPITANVSDPASTRAPTRS